MAVFYLMNGRLKKLAVGSLQWAVSLQLDSQITAS